MRLRRFQPKGMLMISPQDRLARDVLGHRMQLSMVVHNIDEAARFWSDSMGVGPWILIEDALEDRRFVHRGAESPVQMSLALTYAGETQFELITQVNDAPSPYPRVPRLRPARSAAPGVLAR